MEFLRTCLAATIILVPGMCTFGQTLGFPNELAGYRFFADGKLKDLQLTVSTGKDVKRIFGAKCEKRCDYNEDWTVGFEYFDDVWTKNSRGDNGERSTLVLDPGFLGKLRSIKLWPKKPISFADVAFPAAFAKFEIGSTTDTRSRKSKMTVRQAFEDPFGLRYEIHTSTKYDDIQAPNEKADRTGDLVLISYNISKELEMTLFVAK